MPNVNVNRRVALLRRSSGIVLDPDAASYLSGATDPVFISAVNDFFLGVKADGNYTKIDAMWLPAAETQTIANRNLKNPATFTLTAVNAPTWTQYQGYTGNGTTQYLNTNFNVSTNGVAYTQNSNSFGFYSRTNIAQASADAGLYVSGNETIINTRWTDNTFYGRNNGSSPYVTFSTTDSRGLYVMQRPNGTTTRAFKNGAQQNQQTVNSGALLSLNNSHQLLENHHHSNLLYPR